MISNFKNIKHTYLRVDRCNGSVKVSAPVWMTLDEISHFVLSKQCWIQKQKAALYQKTCLTSEEYTDGSSHFFNGKRLTLKVIIYNMRPKVVLKQSGLELHIKDSASMGKRQFVINEWYRQQITDMSLEIINKYENKMGVEVRELRVRNMKTRWGTCNTRAKRIWLNLELAKWPYKCLEYVVVHEMVHLLEASHNKRFYGFMTQFMPKWRTYKSMLKKPLG